MSARDVGKGRSQWDVFERRRHRAFQKKNIAQTKDQQAQLELAAA
jgi:hypothetical protein